MDYFCIPEVYNQPVIGVVTTRKTHKGYPLPLGKESHIYQEMILNARKRGLFIYYFYPDGVHWDTKRIQGHMWMNGSWIRKEFVFPDIVYNRIVHRDYERRKTVVECLGGFEKCPDVNLFNSRFLEKWEVYEALKDHPEAAKVLPATALFSRDSLTDFAHSFEEFFIKPRRSSVGKGIIKVISTAGGHFYYAFSSRQTPSWKRVNRIDSLYARILKSAGMSEEGIIIQEGIRLAQYKKRIFDLRTLVQKDHEGKWAYMGSGIRVAGVRRFVTHIPNGGMRAETGNVISHVFDQSLSLENVEQSLREMVSWLPDELEKRTGLSLGVLSMDIGIDQEGQIKLIEVNSKPAKFDETDIRARHLSTLNDYFEFVYQNANLKKG
ncbi:MAG: YheC/YheD family protein [Bacillota bacterium]|nr:YheC/YheD family protein [Bacillota bacterium]